MARLLDAPAGRSLVRATQELDRLGAFARDDAP
jgi:hypothetical protein